MKKDTRREIIDIAKILFNEKGYNAVSTRDISDALGISKGNLTYHFKKKEDILEAVLREATANAFYDTPQNLKELDDFFDNIQETVRNNSLYFWHYTQFAQILPIIRNKQKEIYSSNKTKLRSALHMLLSEDMIREETDDEYDRIIDSILLTAVYWIPFCDLKQEMTSSDELKRQLWSLMIPLLTANGKNILKGLDVIDLK